jgi:hypothetical protein
LLGNTLEVFQRKLKVILKSLLKFGEVRLRTKVSHSYGLVRESSSLVGSTKVSIEASGNTIYATVIPDKISIRMLKPLNFY